MMLSRFPTMLCRILSCFILALPAVLAAQNRSYGVAGMEGLDGKSTPAAQAPAAPNLCPVSIDASHLSDGNMVRTRANHSSGIGQRLHLMLHSPGHRTIATATVNLRGWTAKGRTAEVSSSDAPGLKEQTLTVPFTPGPDHTVSADIWAPGLTAVVSVEVVSLKYSDGSAWTPPENMTCRVAPKMLMLVTHR